MRSDAVVEPSLGCGVEHAFKRDDREHSAAVVEPVDLGVRACVGHGMLHECSIGMQIVTLRHREVSAVEPATPMSSARPEYQAGSLEVLLRADATATTTMHSSLRRLTFRAMHLSATVSIGRKVWLFAKQSN
jgi:hypothetical protein